MSDGIKAMYEQAEEHRFKEHCERLKAIRMQDLVDTIEDLDDCVSRLNGATRAATRQEWAIIDRMRALLAKLK